MHTIQPDKYNESDVKKFKYEDGLCQGDALLWLYKKAKSKHYILSRNRINTL